MTPIAQLIAELRERASKVMPQSETRALLTCAAEALARQEELLAEAGKWQAALVDIVDLKPEPIGDTGFAVGPAALLRRAREIALEAVRPVRKARAAARLSDKLKADQ